MRNGNVCCGRTLRAVAFQIRPRFVAVLLSGVLALGYAGAIGYVKLNERTLIFRPGDRKVSPSPSRFDLREKRVAYPSSDGVTVSAWIVPAAGASPSDTWLLICHGNFGSIGYGGRPEFYASMRGLGINLLAFDYRGFGESDGAPDERGLYDDATASYQHLTHSLGVLPARIILFGHSLGSGVAIELASRMPAAGLIVEGAYTSIVDRGQELYPFFPIALMATQRFPSLERIQQVEMPKLFLHSPEDSVIPYAHGRRLFDTARAPKQFVDVRGGHDDAYRIDKSVYYGAIAEFLRDTATLPGPADSASERPPQVFAPARAR